MKSKLFSFFLLLSCFSGFSQNAAEAEKLVNEGIVYHDKGDYAGAISKYDQALKADKDNLLALSEKAFSLNSLEKYDAAITVCQLAIKSHPGEDVKNVYVSYGNSLDHLGKSDEAIKIYNEGINMFPNYYQLHFNKGITYARTSKNAEAIPCFHDALYINPNHASSQNAVGILEMDKNRIASILAFSRFLVLEPGSSRAKQNLAYLQALLMQGVTKTGEKSISINIDSETLNDSTETGHRKENNFTTTDLILSLVASQDFDKKNKNNTDVEKFIRKFETICSSLKESKAGNSGFYWETLVPYFIEMNDRNLTEAFAYVAFSSTGEEYVTKWQKKNQDQLDRFYSWSKNYHW